MIEYICPYPYEKSIPIPPFPPHFVVPKFDKYKGKEDPKAHIGEFFTAFIEATREDSYLMIFFPRSLCRQEKEWFFLLPPEIKSWDELAKAFIHN